MTCAPTAFDRRRLPVTLLLLSLLVAGCTRSLEPAIVSLPQPGVRPETHIGRVFAYDVAAATIATVFERDLGFAPLAVTFQFYPHRAALEAALLESGYDPLLARSTASTMTAIGGYRRVLLNASALRELGWPLRVALLAHEMTHCLQYELGGGRRGASDQWLREGFADYVSMRVLERLQAIAAEEYRRQRLAQFRTGSRSKLPPLAAMRTFRQWVALAERSEVALYAQAFLAADFLIDRHGVPAVLDYFERFARSEDRAGNFRAAFGEELEEFERAFVEVIGKTGGREKGGKR